MKIKKYIPITDWITRYNREQLRGDLTAGLTVGVMLVPQGMAYAMLAGLPPIYGLYASILPLVMYAIFGTSRQLAVGPGAMICLLVAAGIGGMAEAGSNNYIELAILLAFMVGVIQLLLGLFRLGFLVNFLSHPVISGFTSAAALVIGMSQLKHLFGMDIPRSHHIHTILIYAGEHISTLHWPTFGVGLAGILLILLLRKYVKKVPGSLAVVVLGIAAVAALGLDATGMKIIREVPSGLPLLSLPAFSMEAITALMPVALTISLIGFMQSIALAKAIEAKHKDYIVDANQELIGLGMANLGGALLKGFPVSGGYARTAVNDQSGARTGMAAIVSAAFIALTLLLLTPLFFYLPQAILASIIMVAAFGLIDLATVRELWRTDRRDLVLLLATFAATLTFGIELGIGVGVSLSLGMMIYRSAYPHVAELGQLENSRHYRNIERFPEAIQRDDILVFRFDAQLYFANISFFQAQLAQMMAAKGSELKLIILNAEMISFTDSSAVRMLVSLAADLKQQNIHFALAGVNGPVRDTLFRSGLTKLLGESCMFLHVADAVTYFENKSAGHPNPPTSLSQAATQTSIPSPRKGKNNT
ncbi:MAG TPA: sulfate permease [Bacteroidetes bacterium]|nr:sulfate permease [Bacteroidota bacterium]